MPTPQPYSPSPNGRSPRPRPVLPTWVVAGMVGAIVVIIAVPLGVLAWELYQDENPPAASETPPQPSFAGFDVCSLISPADAERAGARILQDGDPVRVIARTIRTSDTAVPIDTCEYGTVVTGPVGVSVSVSPTVVYDDIRNRPENERHRIPGLGDEAFTVPQNSGYGTVVAVRSGKSELRIVSHRTQLENVNDAEAERLRQEVVRLAQKAIRRVPRMLTLPRTVASGGCARIAASTTSKVLGSTVAYSRSHSWNGNIACAFAGTNGKALTVRLNPAAEDRDLKYATQHRKLDLPNLSAYESHSVVSVIDRQALLEVDFTVIRRPPGRLAPADLALAQAAADALLT